MLTLSDKAWAEGKRRSDIISPLAAQEKISRRRVESAAKKLKLSSRQVYNLIKKCRCGSGKLTDLAPQRSQGGKGKIRTLVEVENIIEDVIQSFYLSCQKRSVAAVVREIRKRCRKQGYREPSRNTIVSRIRKLDTKDIVRIRDGSDAASKFRPAAGKTPETSAPLEVVQIDHSPVDLIVVEETSREPIGRPCLTLAIDVHTRCIVGLLLTLEAPSATSVGLCIGNIVANKAAYLQRLGLPDVDWPMYGKPIKIHLDNAAEFHSDALKRGCEQHGIKRDYRPKKQPHFGGIIERVIGTAMQMCHELPGTTFSNVQERGKYDSEKRAALTLHELEKWLVLAISTYHGSFHNTLKLPPASLWKKAIKSEALYSVGDEKAFLIDFLPVIERTIRRTGFVIDHIAYYSDALKPWIAKRDRLGKFIIRRDPRDLSRVWVLDPVSNDYVELPYRSISNPSVTLWEHRKAIEKLRESGKAEIDEDALFRTIEKMRQLVDEAEANSKRARREKSRRSHLSEKSEPKTISLPKFRANQVKVKRFEDIEVW